MRLINVKTITLEEFYGDQIPRYAILSHTWGQNHDEVQFSDIGHRRAAKKPGYEKIQYLCSQAANDGLSWAWCDTCCIDKSSSAELSESINSMFQWYRNADVCYAYLSDVTVDANFGVTMDRLQNSRWLRRGWTLQELLAPERVNFYDREWNLVGEKTNLSALLRDVTGINFGAMNYPSSIPSYSIATRMSWASKRKTTRIEDQAYCMLGILGVHMPLLYGEGQNAFRRLQEELVKVSDDETIFAHMGEELLAHSPEQFSSGHELTVLKKSKSAPYSITNAGLHIHMRLLHYGEGGFYMHEGDSIKEGRLALGILNCHFNNATERNHYIALSLVSTGIENTYRRAMSGHELVDAAMVTSVEYRNIFIQLRPMPVSRITLLEDYDRAEYSAGATHAVSNYVHNFTKREIRIYPQQPFRYEAVYHALRRLRVPESPTINFITLFELQTGKAGVYAFPDSPTQRLSVDSIYKGWRDHGRPTYHEFFIEPPMKALGTVIRVSVVQKNEMNQFVWYLQIDERYENAASPLSDQSAEESLC